MGAKRGIAQRLYDTGIFDSEAKLNTEECDKYLELVRKDKDYELPDNVIRVYDDDFRKVLRYPNEDENKIMQLRQIELLTTIKSCLIFFTVLTILSIVVAIFAFAS